MSHRVERFSSTLKHCLGDIVIDEINDPKLKALVITEVITAQDLKKAKIFVAAAVGDVDEIIMHLTKAKGFIKRALAKRMYLKYVPELVFLKDETIEWGIRKENE